MKAFLRSPAGKGTLAVYLAGVLFAWPPALSWLVASILVVFAVLQFRVSFREGHDTSGPEVPDGVGAAASRPFSLTAGECPPVDVNAVLASLGKPDRASDSRKRAAV